MKPGILGPMRGFHGPLNDADVRRVKRYSLRTNVSVHADREVRSRIRAARRTHAALRARACVATRRSGVTAALTVVAELISIAPLATLAAVEWIFVEILVLNARAVAFIRSVRTIVDTLAVEANGIVAASRPAHAAIFIVRIQVHAARARTIHESRTAGTLPVVAELCILALRAAHTAVVRIGTRINASREATAIGTAIAHALTSNASRAKGTRIHARAAEARIGHRIDTDLLAILPRAYGLALGTLALTRNARFTGIAICLAIATMGGIRGQIGARIVASDLTLRTDAIARNARRVGWTIVSAHPAILRILR